MDKLTKQANILYSLSLEFVKKISQEAADSISEEFLIPLDEAKKKCRAFIESLFFYILFDLINEKMDNGNILAKKYLEIAGTTDEENKKMRETYGSADESLNNFKILLYDYLEVPEDNSMSDLFFIRVQAACEASIEMAQKDVDNIVLKKSPLCDRSDYIVTRLSPYAEGIRLTVINRFFPLAPVSFILVALTGLATQAYIKYICLIVLGLLVLSQLKIVYLDLRALHTLITAGTSWEDDIRPILLVGMIVNISTILTLSSWFLVLNNAALLGLLVFTISAILFAFFGVGMGSNLERLITTYKGTSREK